MANVLDGSITRPESIVPWEGEQELVEDLLEKRGGEWVVAAAFLDYGNLTDTTRPIRTAFERKRQRPLTEGLGGALIIEAMARLQGNKELVDEVEDEARLMVEFIPLRQVANVVEHGKKFLDETSGHYGVRALIEVLDPQLTPHRIT